jgi:hypothetical protein
MNPSRPDALSGMSDRMTFQTSSSVNRSPSPSESRCLRFRASRLSELEQVDGVPRTLWKNEYNRLALAPSSNTMVPSSTKLIGVSPSLSQRIMDSWRAIILWSDERPRVLTLSSLHRDSSCGSKGRESLVASSLATTSFATSSYSLTLPMKRSLQLRRTLVVFLYNQSSHRKAFASLSEQLHACSTA